MYLASIFLAMQYSVRVKSRFLLHGSVGYKKEIVSVGRTQSTPLPLALQAGTRRLIFRVPSSL